MDLKVKLSFRGNILAALAMSFVLMLMTAGGLIYFNQIRQLEYSLNTQMRGNERVFLNQINSDAEGLGRALLATTKIDILLEKFLARDRQGLYAQARPFFEELKTQFGITHFYFFEPNGTTFLRVHKPEQFGDQNKRHSFKLAVEKNQWAVSLDMGKNFFSLRAVRPLKKEGQLIGYWELAQEIHHVLPATKRMTGDDVSVLLLESYTQKKGTEIKGTHIQGLTLLESTNQTVTIEALKQFHVSSQTLNEALYIGSQYALMSFPFKDGAGEIAGILIFTKDLTAARAVMYDNIVRNLILIALILALGSAVVLFAVHRAVNQLGGDPAYAVAVTREIAQGNLTVKIMHQEGQDGTLLFAMATMQNKLRQTVLAIQESAIQLGKNARYLATLVKQASQALNVEADATESIAAAVEQVAVSITSVAESAAEARQTALVSGEHSHEGGSVIDRSAEEVARIAETVQRSSQMIAQLVEESTRISAVTAVIKDIADQTNLLALNAAIEAARAGEAGRGFSIVADEVRKLAERTTKSTQEISQIVELIQGSTQAALAEMQLEVQQVGEGVLLAKEASCSIRQIEASTNRVVAAISQISERLGEQKAASEQMATGVQRVAEMTEQNHMTLRDVEEATADLDHVVTRLQQAVDHFRV